MFGNPYGNKQEQVHPGTLCKPLRYCVVFYLIPSSTGICIGICNRSYSNAIISNITILYTIIIILQLFTSLLSRKSIKNVSFINPTAAVYGRIGCTLVEIKSSIQPRIGISVKKCNNRFRLKLETIFKNMVLNCACAKTTREIFNVTTFCVNRKNDNKLENRMGK